MPLIKECLDCLLAQTFKHCTIIIGDNASEDGTTELCADFARRYENVTHFRHVRNIGVMENYRFLVNSCKTPYFMWRADDDLSDLNFTSSLVDLLEKNSHAALAFGNVKTQHSPSHTISSPFDNSFLDNSNSENIIANMNRFHPSSYYGVWRKSYLNQVIDDVWSIFPDAYAHDQLTIFKALVDNKTIGTNKTTFIQRTFSKPKGDGLRGRISLKHRIERLDSLLPKFTNSYDAILEQSNLPQTEKIKILKEKKHFTKLRLRASKIRIFRLKLKLFLKNISKL